MSGRSLFPSGRKARVGIELAELVDVVALAGVAASGEVAQILGGVDIVAPDARGGKAEVGVARGKALRLVLRDDGEDEGNIPLAAVVLDERERRVLIAVGAGNGVVEAILTVDEDAALTLIEDDCRERDIPLVLSVVPQDKAERLAARYPYFRFSSPRVWRDYIYAAEDLRDFAGRRYSGQRNHINKFRKLYPDAAFRPLGKSDLPLITQFFRDYEAVFTKASDSAKNELRCAEKMLRMTGSPHFLVGGMELDGRLLSVAMAERCGDTLQIHIEKALYGYEGVYPATVQAFAQEFAVDGVRWLNREDDAGDKGLRTSKLQYLPDHLGAKLRFDVLNELVNITEIPTLTTARLTLDALTDADKTAYAALCLDDDRNRWWGYDFRKDYDGTPYEDYFLAVAREDYARSRAVNFAVRLDGALIGEVVLYRFDSRGGAELGCRVSPDFAGHGYGTEAFAAVADWALYRLHLAHVVAKCYKENDASYRMLSSCMHRAGEDETFFYFDKEV